VNRRAVALVACTLQAWACGKDDAPKTIQVRERFETRPFPSAPNTDAVPREASAPSEFGAYLLDASAVRAANDEARTLLFGGQGAAAAGDSPPPSPAAPTTTVQAPVVNPDDAILASARYTLGRCFSALRAGPGAGPPTLDAKVQVSVVETGSVFRSEVLSSDVNDPAVLECLRRSADGVRFSDNDGGPLRTYTIDVALVAR
jgi:hypothetical protein